MKTKKEKKEKLKKFEVLDIGMMKKIIGGCGASDADRLCNSLCPTAGCKHDGCCNGYWDSWGDSSCRSSGKETITHV